MFTLPFKGRSNTCPRLISADADTQHAQRRADRDEQHERDTSSAAQLPSTADVGSAAQLRGAAQLPSAADLATASPQSRSYAPGHRFSISPHSPGGNSAHGRAAEMWDAPPGAPHVRRHP